MKPSSQSELGTLSHKSSQASTVYTRAQTSKSSDHTTFQNGGRSQMSPTTSRPRREARHVQAGNQIPQPAHDLHEPLRRLIMEHQHRNANPDGLHVDDALSRRRKLKMKTTTKQRTSTSHRHLHRPVSKTQSQQSAVAESRRRIRQRDLVAANPEPTMRRNQCLLGD